MIMHKKLERRRKRREETKGGREISKDIKEQVPPPSEPAPMTKAPGSPAMDSPHPHARPMPVSKAMGQTRTQATNGYSPLQQRQYQQGNEQGF